MFSACIPDHIINHIQVLQAKVKKNYIVDTLGTRPEYIFLDTLHMDICYPPTYNPRPPSPGKSENSASEYTYTINAYAIL